MKRKTGGGRKGRPVGIQAQLDRAVLLADEPLPVLLGVPPPPPQPDSEQQPSDSSSTSSPTGDLFAADAATKPYAVLLSGEPEGPERVENLVKLGVTLVPRTASTEKMEGGSSKSALPWRTVCLSAGVFSSPKGVSVLHRPALPQTAQESTTSPTTGTSPPTSPGCLVAEVAVVRRSSRGNVTPLVPCARCVEREVRKLAAVVCTSSMRAVAAAAVAPRVSAELAGELRRACARTMLVFHGAPALAVAARGTPHFVLKFRIFCYSSHQKKEHFAVAVRLWDVASRTCVGEALSRPIVILDNHKNKGRVPRPLSAPAPQSSPSEKATEKGTSASTPRSRTNTTPTVVIHEPATTALPPSPQTSTGTGTATASNSSSTSSSPLSLSGGSSTGSHIDNFYVFENEMASGVHPKDEEEYPACAPLISLTGPGGSEGEEEKAAQTVLFQVVPSTGPLGGGVPVTVLGQGFRAGHVLAFGAAVAGDTRVWNAGTLVCTLPPAAHAGPVPVALTGAAAPSPQQTGCCCCGFTYTDDRTTRLFQHALRVLGASHCGDVASPLASPAALQQYLACGDRAHDEAVLLAALRTSTSAAADLGLREEETGRTLLHLAAMCGHAQLAAALLARAPALAALADHRGYTPLHFACLYAASAVAALLLQQPAVDPARPTADGLTARDCATDPALRQLLDAPTHPAAPLWENEHQEEHQQREEEIPPVLPYNMMSGVHDWEPVGGNSDCALTLDDGTAFFDALDHSYNPFLELGAGAPGALPATGEWGPLPLLDAGPPALEGAAEEAGGTATLLGTTEGSDTTSGGDVGGEEDREEDEEAQALVPPPRKSAKRTATVKVGNHGAEEEDRDGLRTWVRAHTQQTVLLMVVTVVAVVFVSVATSHPHGYRHGAEPPAPHYTSSEMARLLVQDEESMLVLRVLTTLSALGVAAVATRSLVRAYHSHWKISLALLVTSFVICLYHIVVMAAF